MPASEIGTRLTLLRKADELLDRIVVKNVAHRSGRTATFMPKPFGDNGSGIRTSWPRTARTVAGDGGGLSYWPWHRRHLPPCPRDQCLANADQHTNAWFPV